MISQSSKISTSSPKSFSLEFNIMAGRLPSTQKLFIIAIFLILIQIIKNKKSEIDLLKSEMQKQNDTLSLNLLSLAQKQVQFEKDFVQKQSEKACRNPPKIEGLLKEITDIKEARVNEVKILKDKIYRQKITQKGLAEKLTRLGADTSLGPTHQEEQISKLMSQLEDLKKDHSDCKEQLDYDDAEKTEPLPVTHVHVDHPALQQTEHQLKALERDAQKLHEKITKLENDKIAASEYKLNNIKKLNDPTIFKEDQKYAAEMRYFIKGDIFR